MEGVVCCSGKRTATRPQHSLMPNKTGADPTCMPATKLNKIKITTVQVQWKIQKFMIGTQGKFKFLSILQSSVKAGIDTYVEWEELPHYGPSERLDCRRKL